MFLFLSFSTSKILELVAQIESKRLPEAPDDPVMLSSSFGIMQSPLLEDAGSSDSEEEGQLVEIKITVLVGRRQKPVECVLRSDTTLDDVLKVSYLQKLVELF